MNKQSPQPAADVFPASPAQARFWFLEKVRPGRPDNTIALRWDIAGDLPSDVLENTLRRVIGRHEILRSRLVECDSVPAQEVLDQVEFKLGLVDIRALPIDDHAARVDRIAREMAAEPFDLAAPPLLRATHVRTGPGRAILLIAVHHCVFDGHSADVLVREVGEFAAATLTGRPPDLPDLRLQYPDYALWQEACAESPARAEETAFWTNALSGAAPFAPPADRAGPHAPARLVVPLPDGADARISEAAARLGVSPFMLGAAAASAALAEDAGAREVLLATAVSGRDEVDLEPLIGVFVNTLVLPVPVEHGATLRQHLERTRETVTAALAHQSCPIEDVVRALRLPRGNATKPFTSVIFGMPRGVETQDHGLFRIEGAPAHAPGIFYDLNLQLTGEAAAWRLVIDYDSGRYSPSRVAALGGRLLAALDALIDAPGTPLADLRSDQPAADPPPASAARQVPDNAAAGPRATPEARAGLARLWAELLDLPPEDCAGDFFELGGHSILALRMLARLEAEFGTRVEVAAFLAEPTLDGLACRIASATGGADPSERSTWRILPLREGASGGPVVVTVNQMFLWHGIARAFAPDRTIVNLTVPDDAALERQRRMDGEALAADAARALVSAFPGRPLVLVGHCADGLTALAAAAALAAAGQPPVLIAMVDAWAPGRPGAAPPAALGAARRAGTGLRRWAHYGRRAATGRLGARDLARRLGPVRRLLRAVGAEPPPTEAERLARAVNDHHQALWESHDFAPWPGEAVLFRTESQPAAAERRAFGWRGVLSEDTPVHRLDGWHEDALLGGGFERMARIVDLRLDRRDGGPGRE